MGLRHNPPAAKVAVITPQIPGAAACMSGGGKGEKARQADRWAFFRDAGIGRSRCVRPQRENAR